VATRLLTARSEQERLAGFAVWLAACGEWLQRLVELPDRSSIPEHAIHDLVVYEESLLERLDAGSSLASAVQWDAVAALQTVLISERRQAMTESLVPPALGRVLLLVSNLLRTSQLFQRLAEGGFSVVICSDADEVISQLHLDHPFQAVVCDEVAPVCNLSCLQELLARDNAVKPPLLIMVTGSSHRESENRARRKGAVGIWSPPYRATDFRKLLSSS
jgi:CheY-like chemotaxis protein